MVLVMVTMARVNIYMRGETITMIYRKGEQFYENCEGCAAQQDANSDSERNGKPCMQKGKEQKSKGRRKERGVRTILESTAVPHMICVHPCSLHMSCTHALRRVSECIPVSIPV